MRLRQLLWFDCCAGAAVGIAMLALSGTLAPIFGIPRSVLVATALVNLAYGTFSFTLARRAEAPRRLVRGLIIANAAWTPVCVVLAVLHAGPGSWLGVAYLIGEGVFVGALAAVEAKVAARELAAR